MVGIRVTAIEARREMAENLQKRLDLPDEHIIWDDRPGGGNARYTVEKAWLDPIEEGETHRVVLNEDVEVCDGFRDICEQIAQAHPDSAVILFTTALNGEYYDAFVRNLKTPYIDHRIGLFGCAIMLPTARINECFVWIEKNCPSEMWDNAALLAWMRHKQYPMITTIPTLVQHIGDDSLVDPTLPVRRSTRFEQTPAADWSCTDIATMPIPEWFTPYKKATRQV